LQSNLLEHKIAFAEICKGYSPRKLDGNDVFVKHPTEDDYLDLDLLHTKVKEECEAKGLPFEAEKLKEASDLSLWSEKDEGEYQSDKKLYHEYNKALDKSILDSQKQKLKEDIDKLYLKLNRSFIERTEVIGKTSDQVIEERKEEHLIKNALFKDKKLKKPFISEQDFDELDREEYDSLKNLVFGATNKFTQDFLNEIAALPFFLNNYLSCKGSVLNLFGKPIVQLTAFQNILFSRAGFYKNVLEQGKSPPDFVYKNPSQLVNWYETTAKQKGSSGGGGNNTASVSSGKATLKAEAIVSDQAGLAKEQAKAENNIDPNTQTVTLQDAAREMMKKTGKKTLNIHDMAKLHGLLD